MDPQPPGSPFGSRVPDGTVVYAIGDIHGRADLLDRLLTEVETDRALTEAREAVLITLGDYVDKGPDSPGVLERLAEPPAGFRSHALLGNHEDALLRFLDNPEMGPSWCDYGGAATLLAYGVRPPRFRSDREGWRAAAAALAEAMPLRHLDFLQSLETSVAVGDYFFVHGGARPGRPLNEQSPADLIAIRDAFLNSAEPFEKVVVHGHSARPDPHSDHRRIGVDTGAYLTGVLTAVRLFGADRRFIHVR